MEQLELLQRQNKMLRYLSEIPKKMILLHGMDNVTEFVLHDLCQKDCFNFNKAAYFVDNPDFNCAKGVAGFCREEAFYNDTDIWQNPKDFSDHMKKSSFNQRIRTINRNSIKHNKDDHDELASAIAKDLGFKNHGYCSWNLRHDNEGIILYEKADETDKTADECFVNGVTLLSFCPIF